MSDTLRYKFVALAIAPVMCLAVSPAAFGANPPIGTKSAYDCEGPYGKSRDFQLVDTKGDVLRWSIKVDGKSQWVEKPSKYAGTTLFARRDRSDGKGLRQQSFKDTDFAGIEALKSGTTFSGKVDESHNKGKWTWNYYSIVVGDREQITHHLLGAVEVTTVRERRKVEGGDYQSEMTVTLSIEPRKVLGWEYKDRKGTESCKLVSLSQPG